MWDLIRLGHWDLRDGRFLGAVDGQMRMGSVLVHGSRYVSLGSSAYEWSLPCPLWEYDFGSMPLLAQGSPDGRLWVVHEQRRGPKSETLLAGYTVPDARAEELSRRIASGEVKPVLGPTVPVQVVANCSEARYNRFLTEACEERVKWYRIKVGPGGLKLVLNATEVLTGGKISYQAKGPNDRVPHTVLAAARKIECEAILYDESGIEVHRRKYTVGPPDTITFTTDIDGAVHDAVWSEATKWARFIDFPTSLYRIDGKIQALPLRSTPSAAE
jgi:hypothetical protein